MAQLYPAYTVPDTYAQLDIDPSLLHSDGKLKGDRHEYDEDWIQVHRNVSIEDCQEESTNDQQTCQDVKGQQRQNLELALLNQNLYHVSADPGQHS